MKQIPLLILLLFFFSSFTYSQLTIIIDEVPANTPADDPIYIAGDFQSWNPGSAAHQFTKDDSLGIYHLTLAAGLGTIEFKFTRGTWAKVESTSEGNFVPNRKHSEEAGDTLLVQIAGWEDLIKGNEDNDGGDTTSGESTATENVYILSDTFYMPQFDRYRRIWIYLPPDYEESEKNYPVLYMHDGQNVFDEKTAYISEWEVDETLNRLHANGDPGIIVVAIDNGSAFRTEEYTPWPHPNFGGGRGGLYIDFIVNTLKPHIDTSFRVKSDRANTGIMGSSFGGLVSTFGGIGHQDIFGKIGSFSPSYWVNSNAFTQVETVGKQQDMSIYQLMGSKEGAQHVNNMFKMDATLKAAGFGDNEVLTVEKSDGEHSEWFWAREFEAAYLWLFGELTTSIQHAITDEIDIKIFPNPGGENMTLEVNLPDASLVEIDIFDLKGQQILRPYSNTLSGGVHQIDLNLSSAQIKMGNYYCRIRLGEHFISMPFVFKMK